VTKLMEPTAFSPEPSVRKLFYHGWTRINTDKGEMRISRINRIQLAIIRAIRIKHCAPFFPIRANPCPSVVKNPLIDSQPFQTGDAPGRRPAFRWVCQVAPGITERLPRAFLHS
jgi:hypothetical protein